MMDTVLFDLDGTIIDSGPGITICAQHALRFFGVEEPDASRLRFFVGPPLSTTFMEHYGFTEEQARDAIVKYRERYVTKGIFECELYPGVEEMLKRLKEQGYRIGLSSSKPEVSCKRILDYFHITDYFDEIVGATEDAKREAKADILREAIARFDIKDAGTAILVGDTKFDAIGANLAGMPCVGVTYGYGSEEELVAEHVVKICHNVKEVEAYFEKE